MLRLNLSRLREEEGTCLEGGIPNFQLDPRGLMSYHESFSLLPFACLTLSIGSLTWEWKMKKIWRKRKKTLFQDHFSELPLLISFIFPRYLSSCYTLTTYYITYTRESKNQLLTT